MVYLAATLLVVVNTFWLVLHLLTLPGNWLMVASTLLVAWWQWDYAKPSSDQMFSIPVLIAIVALATFGEILEFVTGALGSKRVGGTGWGSAGALMGGIAGAVAGTALIPIPLVGSLAGACLGAAAGALGLELLGGMKVRAAVRSGTGAGIGRLAGTVVKLYLGLVIWIVVAVSAFWP